MPVTDHARCLVSKIAARGEWEDACRSGGVFLGSRDDVRDGYIHMSTGPQLAGTAEKHFRGQNNLLLIAYDAQSLGPNLRWETSRGGALFPHVYAGLLVTAALWVHPLQLGAGGVPEIPVGIF